MARSPGEISELAGRLAPEVLDGAVAQACEQARERLAAALADEIVAAAVAEPPAARALRARAQRREATPAHVHGRDAAAEPEAATKAEAAPENAPALEPGRVAHPGRVRAPDRASEPGRVARPDRVRAPDRVAQPDYEAEQQDGAEAEPARGTGCAGRRGSRELHGPADED
jgi:hypothetical protein